MAKQHGRQCKRKYEEQDEITPVLLMDKLNQDTLEKVLSWLPTSTFFRLASVCKRWKSLTDSASFKLACSQVPSREPWFFMVDHRLNQSIILDSAERSWKTLNHPTLLSSNANSIPVSSSGGLVCFRNVMGNFIICNPVTTSCRQLPPVEPPISANQTLHAIAMNTSCNSYKVALVFGEMPNLFFKVYDSKTDSWDTNISLRRQVDENVEFDLNTEDSMYFLSKSGNVVVTNIQRSPSKQFSSVFTLKDSEEIVYFLNSSATVVSCNLTRKSFTEFPKLLPAFSEYSIDIVECNGEMFVVLLSEFFGSSSVRVWKYDGVVRGWHQVAAMPPSISHEFYSKKVDINCAAAANRIIICLSSAEIFSYVLCDLETNEWCELPKCAMDGEAMEFMSAFSFEPRIEACV